MSFNANILLVDDEPEIVKAIKKEFEKDIDCKHSIYIAFSGKEALKILSEINIDILVTDIRMPGIDGFELIKNAINLLPDLQCIVISAFGEIENAIEAMKIGAKNFLVKPFSIDAFEVAIEISIEKLELIKANKEKQMQIQEKNKQLEEYKNHLEIMVEEEIKRRKNAENKILHKEYLENMVDVMNLCLRYWRQTTKKNKVALAEESDIWAVNTEINKEGEIVAYVTRVLNTYLRFDKIPKKNPNYNKVIETVDFVLYYENAAYTNDEIKEELKEKVKELEKSRQEYLNLNFES